MKNQPTFDLQETTSLSPLYCYKMTEAPKVWQVVKKGSRMLKLQDFFLLEPSFNNSLKGGATTLYVMLIKKLRSVFATLVSERKKSYCIHMQVRSLEKSTSSSNV